MGAALTYARRYALFTLVGIAGEDDLDAPDLSIPTSQASEPRSRRGTATADRMAVNAILLSEQLLPATERSASIPTIRSSGQRLRLNYATDFWPNSLMSAPPMRAAIWAHRNLRAKNDLTAADAQRVEEAFQARLATLPAGAGEPVQHTPMEDVPACSIFKRDRQSGALPVNR